MKYFEVAAKCGHVGRNYYYEGHFFVQAPSAKIAAGKVKCQPRVKRDHKDAILWVNEVDELAYRDGLEDMRKNPYFHCKAKHEQNCVLESIRDGIKPETEKQFAYRKAQGGYYKDKQFKDKPSRKKGVRNPYKYAKYNKTYDKIDLYIA
ncbi:MAG: hypothetical protein K2N23_06525 [Clostridia bacterium]|nr:hypothetical protein [Clostridia bacterium]